MVMNFIVVNYQNPNSCFRGTVTQSTFWDMLVFSKIQKLLGGRVRVIITGSAPVSATVLDFIRICFGCMVSTKNRLILL